MNTQKIKYYEDILFANVAFGNFRRNVNKTQLRVIDEKVHEFSEKVKRFSKSTDFRDNATVYENALCYLAGNCGLTTNEKILFLIRLLDPSLEMYAMYKEYSNQIINEDENGCIQNISLFEQSALKRKIEDKFGFYNPYLLKFEEICSLYYRNVNYKKKNDTHLTTNLRLDYITSFIEEVKASGVTFENLTTDKLENIIDSAYEYIKKYGKPSLNDLIFQLCYELKRDNIESLSDKVVFIIYVMDKDLIYSQIYDQTYSYSSMQKYIKEVMGTFNQALLDMELQFVDNFEDARSMIS